MRTDPLTVGRQIYILRKMRGLTQTQLADRLHLSFQAVSKWERGETMPDVGLLPELAESLETSIDNILTGGERVMEQKVPAKYTRTVTIAQLREGILCFQRIGELLGKDSFFYFGAIGGVYLKMNMELDKYLEDEDPYRREAMVAEAASQAIMNGAWIDPEDIRTGFEHEHWVNIVSEFGKKYGIQ